MRSWTGIPELRASYGQLGPARFWGLMLGVLAWIGIGAWLCIALNYPTAYGSTCHRKCLIEDYWFSPVLLQQGGLLELALFAWLWALPALAVFFVIRARLRKQARSRNLIQPINRSDPE